MLIADVLHDCKVSGFAEKERLRIEKILKKNPMRDAKAVPYQAKIKRFCKISFTSSTLVFLAARPSAWHFFRPILEAVHQKKLLRSLCSTKHLLIR
jgi:hypothetical protein